MAGGEGGATVVITHRVEDGHQAGYETWLEEVSPCCSRYPGFVGSQIIRPVAGLTGTFTVVIRFDTRDHLEAWMGSVVRRKLVEKVRPLPAKDDEFYIQSGLDFWFVPDGTKARVPVRWKQFLVTWSAIYPLALFVPLAILPALRGLGMVENRYTDTLIVSAVIVVLMVTLIMPNYTKLVRHWLFK
ncbi:antibiotic biosynthesis monooxygenase [Hwanghaeella grinnelliae]|uniref:Antibiotic biosynthesis monooxygenase n=1 Tax=Hwanghaeella grinnelliae TaxID=2500179 RepID=A0A437QJZ3_9PROT|nr:antibiotic biosynthesis monooxygenase [Hwanghaeella grinnelliae]RVU34831.1 antibiotic biosynthesis monooxygenase [Hwanghaeella grinnelliae]